MGRATVRAAVVDYFQDTPGISTLAQAEPWFTPGQAWMINGLPGTACFVHLDHETETVVTIGGTLAQRARTYDIALVVQYQYTIPLDAGEELDTWSDGLDELLDAIVLKLRADPSLGCGSAGPIWQAGIGDMDIVIQSEMPIRDAGKIWAITYVMFKAVEIVGVP